MTISRTRIASRPVAAWTANAETRCPMSSRIRMAILHVRSVATNAAATPAATGRLNLASFPLKLAVTAVKTRMDSRPSRNTSTAIFSVAEARSPDVILQILPTFVRCSQQLNEQSPARAFSTCRAHPPVATESQLETLSLHAGIHLGQGLPI